MRSTPGVFALFISLALVLLAGAASSVSAQTAATTTAQVKTTLNSYRGVEIGMTKDQVHDKLGKVKEEFADEDDFELSDSESVRVFYKPDKTVKALVITYTGSIDAAPKPKAVVGVEVTPNPDGGMYKMVRFPNEGFWVSYVKTVGDNPTVIITLQGMPKQS